MSEQFNISGNKRTGVVASLFIYISIILLSINCASGNAMADGDGNKKGHTFNETALFLAGKELPEKSELNKYTRTEFYQSYKEKLENTWNVRQADNIQKINSWREENLSGKYTDTIYYPFAGPDILNAVVFFPEGSEYLMFGLEAPGEIPEPQKMTGDEIRSGIAGLGKAVSTILQMNFFKTKEMQTQISTSPFNSVKSVMMFFLGRLNYEVLDVKKIWLDDNAAVIENPDRNSRMLIPGSMIAFRKSRNQPIKRIYYFQVDVSNKSLSAHKNYISYLNGKKDYTTIIKAASYLMHIDREFSTIRDLTLAKSAFLLQEDSGIPFKFFSGDKWKLSFYGIYIKPINLFAARFQPDFKKAMEKYSKGPLPFIYGYNFEEKRYNLMFAERNKQ